MRGIGEGSFFDKHMAFAFYCISIQCNNKIIKRFYFDAQFSVYIHSTIQMEEKA